MPGYLTKRFFHSIIIVIGISIAVFLLSRITGDPVSLMVGFDTSKEDREILRKELGLDRPVFIQYFIFVKGAVRGDFGENGVGGKPERRNALRHGKLRSVILT